jgi:hypothetical protein
MHADPLTEASRCLAAEFPAFTFSTQRTHGGRSLVAEPRPGVRTPIRVVITSDPAEMRATLTPHQETRPPR